VVDWPESGGSALKSYPECLWPITVTVVWTPWCASLAQDYVQGTKLPRRLAETRQTIDFDFTTDADGALAQQLRLRDYQFGSFRLEGHRVE